MHLRILFDGRVDEACQAEIEVDVAGLYGVTEAVIGDLASRADERFVAAQRLIEQFEGRAGA